MLVASAQETPPKASEKIPATQAKNHIGSEKIVTGRIVEVNKAEKLVRLNFEKPFPKQSFTAVIFAGKTNLFPDIEKLKDKFDKPLRIESLARELGMSLSGFHAHFKAVTNLSPLQFQKHIRLQEARRLMISENLDAREAGYRVGYEDAAYFSRDYKRHFGEPPMRDAERMKEMATA